MNINTETGRLSCRRPNLQNQPALEKDRYKIRRAFTCSPGNKLIVADYGQLELRLLAHITNCKSMIDAFKKGGDFHSRTAVGMYSHVGEAIEQGKVLLEWDSANGEPPVPLLKDVNIAFFPYLVFKYLIFTNLSFRSIQQKDEELKFLISLLPMEKLLWV